MANLKSNDIKQFADIFPWHYDPLKKNHNDCFALPKLSFDFGGLVSAIYQMCDAQGDPRKNNRGFSYYLNENLDIDFEKFEDRDERFKRLMNLWIDSGWTADNSCFWEFHDEELGEFYEPLLKEYSSIYPDVQHSQIRVIVKPPMTALGLHADTYGTFTRKYNVPKEQVFRVLTFAQDWDWGHYFLMGNHVCHQYSAGDSYKVNPNVWHLSANNGVNPKVTVTYTGIIDD